MFVKELLCVKSGSRLRWNLGNLCQSILDGGLIKNKTSQVLVICLKSTAVNMVIYRPWDHSITTLASLLLQVISDNLLPLQSLSQNGLLHTLAENRHTFYCQCGRRCTKPSASWFCRHCRSRGGCSGTSPLVVKFAGDVRGSCWHHSKGHGAVQGPRICLLGWPE